MEVWYTPMSRILWIYQSCDTVKKTGENNFFKLKLKNQPVDTAVANI